MLLGDLDSKSKTTWEQTSPSSDQTKTTPAKSKSLTIIVAQTFDFGRRRRRRRREGQLHSSTGLNNISRERQNIRRHTRPGDEDGRLGGWISATPKKSAQLNLAYENERTNERRIFDGGAVPCADKLFDILAIRTCRKKK